MEMKTRIDQYYKPSNLFWLAVFILKMRLCDGRDSFSQQYCEDETFDASCSNDEVIIINKAEYGRMNTGKCISDYAFLMGCSTNVLPFLEFHCSGRRSCSVPVAIFMANGLRNCSSELRNYLEASYSCLKVAIPNGHCRSASPVSIANTDTEGYISSYITQQTGCGNSENPWMLRVGQGQIINLTLIDFTNMRTVPQAGNEHLCAVYANVREGDGVITHTVCGGRGKKISSVFVSVTNVVEIKITSKSNQIKNDAQYLLKYTVEGCADPDLPERMWMKRDALEALVGCKADMQMSWILKCVLGKWEGQVGICSSSGASVPTAISSSLPGPLSGPPVAPSIYQKDITLKAAASQSDKRKESNSPITTDMLVAVISLSAVFVTMAIFVLVIVYLKRKNSSHEYQTPMQADHLTYGQTVHTIPSPRDYAANTHRKVNSSTISSFKYHSSRVANPPPPPPSYEMYATTRNIMPSTIQSTTYPYSETSSAYNTVNHCQSPKEHIYESTFAGVVTVVNDSKTSDDVSSEHKYFLLEPNCVHAE